MISPNDVLDVLEEKLKEALPGDKKFYRDLVPENAERPCSMAYCGECSVEQMNAGLYAQSMVFHIRSLSETDARHYSHLQDLYEKMAAILGVFSNGFFRVKKRALKVTDSKGTSDLDGVSVTVSLTVTLAKEDLQAEDVPMMQEFMFQTKHQTGGKL